MSEQNTASVEGALARLAAVIESRKVANGGDPEKAMSRACCTRGPTPF
jgi:phosphoribosyl-ATP pyrophosphohydrolase